MDLLKQVLSTPLWVIVVAAIIAIVAMVIGGVLGGILATIIWGLIALYGIAWFLSFVIAKTAVPLVEGLAQAARDFAEALQDVLSNCPEQCRGDTSTPECSVTKLS